MPPYADKKEKISQYTDLKSGDHIVFERDSGYGHHALVSEVNEKEVKYIHFAPPDDASSSATSLASSGQSSGSSNSGLKGEIHQSTKTLNQLHENKHIFRLHYDVDLDDVTNIIARARSRIGESGYNLFKNNCEHFVRWCRTGTKISYQVERVIRTCKNAIVNNIGKATSHLVAMIIGPRLRNVAIEVVAEIVERLAKMPYGMEILGAVVAAGFELYGFYQYYKEQKNKDYRQRKENLIVEGSVRAGRWAGMVFGGILGEKAGGVLGAKAGGVLCAKFGGVLCAKFGAWAGVILGPAGIPVGCFAGAVVGAAVGTVVGSLLGAGVGGFLRRFAWWW